MRRILKRNLEKYTSKGEVNFCGSGLGIVSGLCHENDNIPG